jgi:uncharacterized protein (TIGR02271 family)
MSSKESKMALNNSTLNAHRRAIGTFPSRSAAEQALHELRDSGFPMDRVSVVAQDSKKNETIAGADMSDRADNKADDGAKAGALGGGALGGLTGLLVGIGALAIPGIGPIMLAGAAATALATTLAGGAIGAVAGSLLGGLVGMGIPEERARVYSDRVSAGEYLVIVDGTDAEISRAEAILNHRGIEEWGVYDIPKSESATVVQPTAVAAPSFEIARPATPVLTEPVLADSLPVQPISTTDDDAIRLYEERLVVDKDRQKTGEVAIGKHVEVDSASASVPIEKERVVIERVASGDTAAVTAGPDTFNSGEAIRMEVYEETPDIHKEAFVREEVSFRKEVTQETVNAEETVRREELDVDTQGRPVVDDRH